MDRIAACRIGLARTIPPGMEPGSDVANLSLLGYDPRAYHTRRAPFEAASMGVELASDDVAFRMNLVTLEHRSDHEIIMISHSSGDIPQKRRPKSFSTSRSTSSTLESICTGAWVTVTSWSGKRGLRTC
jgi:2,3-bisphosphoglycerate-independent phosphoglycerate mutase